MELLFESRPDLSLVSGKCYFFQNRPTLSSAPVLGLDCFAEACGTSIYGSVLRDGGRYRMWYQAWPGDWNGDNADLVGYAESDDGIEWTKPRLDLVDYGGDSPNFTDLGFHAPAVFIDPTAPPSHRYRATGCTGAGRKAGNPGATAYGYYTAHSADGLHWELDSPTPTWSGADVITSAWHPQQNRAVIALKHCPRIGGFYRRSVWTAELRDGAWSPAVSALLPDEYDDIAAVSRGFVSGDYYGMGLMPAGSGTVGFLWDFRHSAPRTASDAGFGVFGGVDVHLVYQNSPGDRWQHLPGRPDFICHRDVNWSSEGLYQGGIYTASCPVAAGNETRLYLSASAHTHGWYVGADWKVMEDLKQELIDVGMARVGYASWTRDRLFGFRADPEGSVTVDLPPCAEPRELRLNLRTTPRGWAQVELLGVPERGKEDAIPLNGDHLEALATWRDGARIPPSPDKPVKVRIHLRDAEIYAFEANSAT
jgi:hypothetical protein